MKEKKRSVYRIIAPPLILLLGIIGMRSIIARKKPPAELPASENIIRAETIIAKAAQYPSELTGYGVAKVLHSAAIAPQISGQVTAISPRLKVGEVFKNGEMLFKIDSRDYSLAAAGATALAQQLQQKITTLQQELQLSRTRLPAQARLRDLAQAEMKRAAELFSKNKVGTQSGVEQAESAYERALDQYNQLKNRIDLMPAQIAEAKAALQHAESQAKLAELNLERCTVKAPFNGRITRVAVYVGDFVSPAKSALMMADDSLLEISVPLDTLTASHLMRFEPAASGSWFSNPEQVPCKIRWTADEKGHTWTGRLERVSAISSDTRSISAAVRIDAAAARNVPAETLPLADGMFCSIKIPGRVFSNTVRLPRTAVDLNSEIRINLGGRLRTQHVKVDWFDNDYAYIRTGITNGTEVVTTRLIDAPDGSKLNVVNNTNREPAKP